MKRCFFIGHHDIHETIAIQLTTAIEHHIRQYDVHEFVVGHYGEFDRMVTKALQKAKEQYPFIRLYRLIPYHPATRKIDVPEGFDGTIYPKGAERVAKRLAIIYANQYMIDTSDYLIVYMRHAIGKTADFVEYAKKKRALTITML